MATATPPEEMPPPEHQEQCDVCGRVARKIIWAPTNYDNPRPEENGSGTAEQSTSQERPGRRRKLCSRCYSYFCRIEHSSMKAKQATLDLFVAWRRGKSREEAGAPDVFIKIEPGEPEDVWENLEELPEYLPKFEMDMAEIEHDIFPESDAPSKHKRLSDIFAWGKWKLSSSNVIPHAGNRIVKSEPQNSATISSVWICNLCNDISSDRNSAEKHAREMHNATSAPAVARPPDMRNEGLREIPGSENQENQASQKSFQCPICNARFGDRLMFLTHLTQSNKQSICRICKVSCEKKPDLDYHNTQHKSKVPGPRCVRCHAIFSDHIFFSAHQEYCEKNPTQEFKTSKEVFSCQLCMSDINVDGVTEHLLKHRGTCRICLRNFEFTHELEVHSAVNHKIQLFHCPRCPDIFTTSKNLDDHFLTHKKGVIPSIFRRKWPRNLSHDTMPFGKNVTCDECKLVFFKRDQYLAHLQHCHVEEFPHIQPSNDNESQYDETNFPTNSVDSKQDIKLRVFNCTFCGNSYTNQRSLQSHISEDHRDEERQASGQGYDQMHIESSPEPTTDPLAPSIIPYNNNAYCRICRRVFQNAAGFQIHWGKMHRSKAADLKRERPNTPLRNTNVQQNPEVNTHYRNESESKYRPDGKRRNLHPYPINNTMQPGQNWLSSNETIQFRQENEQPMPTPIPVAVPLGNNPYSGMNRPNDEQQRTCRFCDKVCGNVKGLSVHLAWHRKKNALSRQRPDMRTGQLPATEIKQEQPIPRRSMREQPTRQTRNDTNFNSYMGNAPFGFGLMWETSPPALIRTPKEEIIPPNDVIDNQNYPNPPEEEYSNDYDSSTDDAHSHRYRNRYVSNDTVWKCNKCKVHLPSEALYQEHKLMHLNLERQPGISEESMYDGQESPVHRINGLDIFECYLCFEKFFLRRELASHKITHQENQRRIKGDGGKYNCPYCKTRLKGEKAILTHLKTHGIKSKQCTN